MSQGNTQALPRIQGTLAEWKADRALKSPGRGRAGEWKEWARIHLRRWIYLFHSASAGGRAIGPLSFLGVAAAMGAALTLTTLYTTSYTVNIGGEELGAVADQSVVDGIIRKVEQEGTALLGRPYQVDGQVDYQFVLTLKSDLTDKRVFEDYFYGQLSRESDQLRKYELKLDGRSLGIVQDEKALDQMLEGIKARYVTANTIDSGFVEKVSVDQVYTTDATLTVEKAQEELTASSVGETTYTVVRGDTFNAIAHQNDMSVADLKALNPDIDINRLMVGDVLNVKEEVPVLSVYTTDLEIYNEPIECPVETVEDSSMYKGDSKILTQGEEGEARIEANVTYVNGYEREREILSTTTLREPTVTVKAVGTKAKPKTASTGRFIWPVSGRISSYFGGRTLRGKYNYHSGLDIAVAYGTRVKAADGGTVTFAGWKGTYGKLVIITHDNGTQTYYAHNSTLLVSAGDKVYQGQAIAKVGMTGNTTGPHCHFEVRVRGSAVNPLNYLR